VGDGGVAHAAAELGDQRHLALEQGGRGDVPIRPALAQLGVRHGVEGPGRHAIADAQGREAGPQLTGGLAGEREGEDVAALGRALGDPPRHAAGEDPRLAGPGAGEDDERGTVADDGGGLRIRQSVEQSRPVHSNECTKGV
jgi:hypothetical protein